MLEQAERTRRTALSNDEAMADAQRLCVPCRLCGGSAKITDAGLGWGYYIRCDGVNRHKRSLGCFIDVQQLGGWAYNVMDWWNRLHAVNPPPKDKMTDVELKAQVDQARVSGFAEGIERAAKIADEHAAHFEKQAAAASSDSMHDALLLAADGCELTADAIRAVMGGSTE